jgi:hypothetical protein
MYSEVLLLENPTAHDIKSDPKRNAEQKLNFQNQGREGRRLTRLNERHVNRKNIVENDKKTFFNKPTFLYKNIRNPLNDKFERDEFEKGLEEKKLFMNVEKIPYYILN